MLQPITGYFFEEYWRDVPTLNVNQSNGNLSVPSSYNWSTTTIPLVGRWSDDVRHRIGYIFTVSGNQVTIKYYSTQWIYDSGQDNPQYEYYLVTEVYESYQETFAPDWTAKQFAGGGGGASATTNGGNASNNNGGAGANASVPSVPTVRGSGGTGGNGGGGGAGGGGASVTAKAGYTTAKTVAGGTAGAGGTGSAGSSGAAGCILIYY